MVKNKMREIIVNDTTDNFLDDMNNVNFKTEITEKPEIIETPPKPKGRARSIMSDVINESQKPKKKQGFQNTPKCYSPLCYKRLQITHYFLKHRS